jgi:hypothetical protein
MAGVGEASSSNAATATHGVIKLKRACYLRRGRSP